MKITKLNVFKFIFFLGVGLLLIWLALRNLTEEDTNNIVVAFQKADYFWIGVSTGLSITSHVIRCIRWKILLEPLGYKPSLRNTFFALMVGYLANFALPRLGEVSRCGVLAKYENIPFSQSFGTVVAERVIDLLCIIIIFFATLYFQFDQLWTLSNDIIITPISNKLNLLLDDESSLSIFGGIMLLLTFSLLFIRNRRKNRVKKEGEGNKLAELLDGFINGLKAVKDIKHPIQFFIHTILIWGLYVLALIVGFYCFEETSNLGIDAGFAVLIFSTVGVMLTPGGTGASQLLITEALTSVFKVTFTFAFAIAWLVWTAQFVALLILGVLSLILLPILNKETAE